MKNAVKGNTIDKNMKIRHAYETDAEQIVKLMQQSFDRNMLNMMIIGCHGIGKYVKESIATPKLSDTFYMVAEENGYIIGCIELRLTGKTIFLNYICTIENMRHKGVAIQLLRQAILTIGYSFYDKMGLDVFHDNFVAKIWYEKLGFISEYNSGWWSMPIIAGNTNETGKVSGLAQANICQKKFGFSQFIVNTSTSTYTVGRLGSNWFRISQENLLNDDQAIATLYRLDPKRRLLGIFNDNVKSKALNGKKPVFRSVRMTVDLSFLLKKLTD